MCCSLLLSRAYSAWPVRQKTEEHRRDRRPGGDREDTHASGRARAGAAALGGALSGAPTRGLTRRHNNGSAIGPTLSLERRLRAGVKVHWRCMIRADAELESLPRGVTISKSSRGRALGTLLIPCRLAKRVV